MPRFVCMPCSADSPAKVCSSSRNPHLAIRHHSAPCRNHPIVSCLFHVCYIIRVYEPSCHQAWTTQQPQPLQINIHLATHELQAGSGVSNNGTDSNGFRAVGRSNGQAYNGPPPVSSGYRGADANGGRPRGPMPTGPQQPGRPQSAAPMQNRPANGAPNGVRPPQVCDHIGARNPFHVKRYLRLLS